MQNTTFDHVELGQHFCFFEQGQYCEFVKISPTSAVLANGSVATDFSKGFGVLALDLYDPNWQ
jgi:hypothetical protein